MTLVHTGNAIVDVALTIGALPDAGGDVLASASAVTAGGAVNTMVAAVRDGLPVTHVGARGTGPFASVVARALEAGRIRAAGPVVTVDTGFSVVLVDADAERTFVTSVGAEARLSPADLAAVEVGDDDIVVVSGYSLAHTPDVLPRWVAGLRSAVRVVFDPSPLVGTLDPAALELVLSRADVVTANSREARILVGAGAAGSDPAAADVCARLAARVRPGACVLVRDGAAGCWVSVAGPSVVSASRVSASPVLVPGFAVDAVDTTGAGDAHCGVLCAALSRGAGLLDAVRRANAAAALAVARRGPATAPTAAEIDALLAA